MLRIEVLQADITQLDVDAIVNAANGSLKGGGGVDGAIHRVAGPGLLHECIRIGSCPTGEARITKGNNLKAKHVIHAVGPVWYGGNSNESDLLASCYGASLKLAVENNCISVAFPNISTGIYGFPKQLAAPVAIRQVQLFLSSNLTISKVIFCCFDSENYQIYIRNLAR